VWGERSFEHEGTVAWLLDVLRGRAKAFLLLAGLGLALITSFLSGIILEAISQFASELPTGRLISNYTNPIISVLINTPIFASIYKLQPRSDVQWRDVWMGAFLASATWEVGRQVLALFVISDRYNTYGVVGSFIAIMAWVYYASNVFFFGAEFVRVTQLTREEREASIPLPGATRTVIEPPKESDLPESPGAGDVTA
jgi:membrane protein